MTRQNVNFETTDGVRLAATLVRPDSMSRGTAVLLHMMPETRSSWATLAAALAERGVASLAVDLRGHGESVQTVSGRELDYRNFTDAEHQASRLDVLAALEYLATSQPDLATRYLVAGASIGANLSLRHAADHGEARAAVALSPGLDYRGVATEDAVARLRPEQALWLGASRDDQHGSWEAVQRLMNLHPATVFLEEKLGHGTDMLARQPALVADLADWMAEKLA